MFFWEFYFKLFVLSSQQLGGDIDWYVLIRIVSYFVHDLMFYYLKLSQVFPGGKKRSIYFKTITWNWFVNAVVLEIWLKHCPTFVVFQFVLIGYIAIFNHLPSFWDNQHLCKTWTSLCLCWSYFLLHDHEVWKWLGYREMRDLDSQFLLRGGW